jgi:hypothetical protein
MLHTLVPDLNIAPLKYAHVHKSQGGPLADYFAREAHFLGQPLFEAFATLDPERSGCRSAGDWIHGGAHGSGSAATRPQALFAAISEALRFWAWKASAGEAESQRLLGLDLDPTASGFAAFPGLGRQGARKRAYFAAAADWTIREWWLGHLAHRPLVLSALTLPEAAGLRALQIHSPTPAATVVLLLLEAEGKHSYASAAAHSAPAAAALALGKLQRQHELLRNPAQPSQEIACKRLLYFGFDEGARRLRKRLDRQGKPLPAPALVVDRPVPGPWAEYAHVWRCLFASASGSYPELEDFFFF